MGKNYVRVSDILAQVQSFAHIDPVVLQIKADMGTNVHEAIGQIVQGEFPILHTVKAVPYLKSYELWHADVQPEYLVMEKRMYCDDFMLTGQIDAIVRIPGKANGEYHLLDYKTSYTPNPEIWKLQAHMYHYLCQKSGYNVVDEMRWLNLLRTGKMAKEYVFTFEYKTMQYCIELINKYWEDYNNARTTEL